MAAIEAGRAGHTAVGRPRDESLDGMILQAVRELLAERGYQALSVQEVTRRCDVHVRTITRRWPTKAELVAAAVLGGDAPPDDPGGEAPFPSGQLRADLRRLVGDIIAYLGQPATRAAMPALLGEMRTDPNVAARVHRRQHELAAIVRAVLDAAVASGDAPERVLARCALLPNLLTGAAFSTQAMETAPVEDVLIDEVTDLLLAAVLDGWARPRLLERPDAVSRRGPARRGALRAR